MIPLCMTVLLVLWIASNVALTKKRYPLQRDFERYLDNKYPNSNYSSSSAGFANSPSLLVKLFSNDRNQSSDGVVELKHELRRLVLLGLFVFFAYFFTALQFLFLDMFAKGTLSTGALIISLTSYTLATLWCWAMICAGKYQRKLYDFLRDKIDRQGVDIPAKYASSYSPAVRVRHATDVQHYFVVMKTRIESNPQARCLYAGYVAVKWCERIAGALLLVLLFYVAVTAVGK